MWDSSRSAPVPHLGPPSSPLSSPDGLAVPVAFRLPVLIGDAGSGEPLLMRNGHSRARHVCSPGRPRRSRGMRWSGGLTPPSSRFAARATGDPAPRRHHRVMPHPARRDIGPDAPAPLDVPAEHARARPHTPMKQAGGANRGPVMRRRIRTTPTRLLTQGQTRNMNTTFRAYNPRHNSQAHSKGEISSPSASSKVDSANTSAQDGQLRRQPIRNEHSDNRAVIASADSTRTM